MSNLWWLDGVDLWLAFNIILEEGSADFLKYPPKKASTEHDWGDANGVEVDLQRIFFQKREGVLNMAILCNTETEFFQKHDAFIAHLTRPGLRRLELASHNNRSYEVYYQECNNYKQATGMALRGVASSYQIAHRFSVVVVEPEPKINPQNVYLVNQDGKFLIM